MIVVTATVWPSGRNPDHITRSAGDRYGELRLVQLIIINDGSGIAHGANGGGFGNYDVFEGSVDDVQLARSRGPEEAWRHIGRIEAVPRDEGHRAFLVRRALELLEEAQ